MNKGGRSMSSPERPKVNGYEGVGSRSEQACSSKYAEESDPGGEMLGSERVTWEESVLSGSSYWCKQGRYGRRKSRSDSRLLGYVAYWEGKALDGEVRIRSTWGGLCFSAPYGDEWK